MNKMKNSKRVSFLVMLTLGLALSAQAREREPRTDGARQDPSEWNGNLKTNLLYDATATFNLGAEFRTGGKTSLDVPFNWNPWTIPGNHKWKHLGVQPELRWWPKGTFNRHFWGLHAHSATYNVGNLPDPFSSDYMKANRFEGWLAGAGITYGYRWNFRDSRWALEAAIGAGYVYKDFERFDCMRCGEKIDEGTEHYFGPTKVAVNLVFNLGRRRAPVQSHIPPVYVPYVPAPEPEPVFLASFVTPEAEAVKSRFEEGRAYLDFAVNRVAIAPGFSDNAAELQKIYTSIESVRSNPDATITDIGIIGYASPEGTYASNISLSERRAQALKDHLLDRYGLPESLFNAKGAGEDWAGLDSLVERSYMPEKQRILEIIRGTDIFAGRERQLMELASGRPYRQMQAEMFPRLRRTEYTIGYTVVPFTVEQGKEVMMTRPGTLSLNEMFLIADTYAPGSNEFNEVFETAARIFPDSDVANLNAAASALSRKDEVSAARYLSKIRERTPEYWNNMGILSWLRGDKTAAAEAFAKAGAAGASNAAELEKFQTSSQ
jgi:hypothetical protein